MVRRCNTVVGGSKKRKCDKIEARSISSIITNDYQPFPCKDLHCEISFLSQLHLAAWWTVESWTIKGKIVSLLYVLLNGERSIVKWKNGHFIDI